MSPEDGATARGTRAVLTVQQLSELLELLRAEGFDLIGPTVQQGAIVSAPIQGLNDLPRGVGDEAPALA